MVCFAFPLSKKPILLIEVLAGCAGAITIGMLIVWLLSLYCQDASIVDIAWGLGFVLVAWTAFSFACRSMDDARTNLLLPVLTTVWGVRLSGHLFLRNHRRPEDYRYQAMRRKWGERFPWVSLVTVFGVQGLVMWVVSLPVQIGSGMPGQSINAMTMLGIACWGIGLFFESVGDWQLARFKSNPANVGRVLDTGVWRYTRHPNYFGDFLVWWGFFLVSFSLTAVWWTVVGPVTMSIFLTRISGVTLLEKSLSQTKPEYAEYVARTNAFFPGPRRR